MGKKKRKRSWRARMDRFKERTVRDLQTLLKASKKMDDVFIQCYVTQLEEFLDNIDNELALSNVEFIKLQGLQRYAGYGGYRYGSLYSSISDDKEELSSKVKKIKVKKI